MDSTTGEACDLSPDNAVFLLICFEGPDGYSMVGGLGIRVTQMTEALVGKGFPTQLVFVGDPHKPRRESRMEGRLLLHRQCQWVSRYYPDGVYTGDEAKLYDFNESVPPFVLKQIARPAIAAGKTLVVLGEGWHAAEAMCRLSDLLHHEGMRERAVLFWNANDTMSFHRIDWGRLAFTTTMTTVSKYMKHLMWSLGVNAQVIPNGIPNAMLGKVDHQGVMRLRTSLGKELILCKVAEWGPDKGWNAAIEATATIKRSGIEVVLLARGGAGYHEAEVLHKAAGMGLRVTDSLTDVDHGGDYITAIAREADSDVVNIKCPLPMDFRQVLYRSANAVLANGDREPSGLVGLEAMASGGLVLTGATSEDYAIHNHNCVVQETGDSSEMVSNILHLRDHPAQAERIRKAARNSAKLFTWENVVDDLIRKAEQQAVTQRALRQTSLREPERKGTRAPMSAAGKEA